METKKEEHLIASPVINLSTVDSAFLSNLFTSKTEAVPDFIGYFIGQFTTFGDTREIVKKAWKQLPFYKRLIFQKSILNAYVERYKEIEIGPNCFINMASALIEDYRERGFLMSRTHFIEHLKSETVQQELESSPKIKSLGIVTGNRVESLKRAVESYVSHISKYGRDCRYVICDDSTKPENAAANREFLSDLAKKTGARIAYSGKEERINFAKKLVEKGLDPDLINFAFVNENSPYSRYGTNRNVLQLATHGEMFFSADDDTVGNLRAAPNYEPGLKIELLGTHKQDIKSFQSHAEALNYVKPLDQCLLDLHEKVLGKSLGQSLIDNGMHGQFDLEGLGAQTRKSILRNQGRVLLSFNGLVGDSGSGEQIGHLFIKKENAKEIFQSPENYQIYAKKREIVKSTNRMTLTRVEGCMTTFYGLDNRKGLPPFFPFFRMEDAIFAATIARCEPLGFYSFLPWELEHHPLKIREKLDSKTRTDPANQPPNFVTAHEIFIAATRNFLVHRDTAGQNRNLEKLGSHLLEFCQLPIEEYRELLIETTLIKKANEIVRLETLLKEGKKYPDYWKQEVKAQIAMTKAQMEKPIIISDIETYRQNPPEGETQTLKLMKQFAKLLMIWPDILKANQELKNEGHEIVCSLN